VSVTGSVRPSRKVNQCGIYAVDAECSLKIESVSHQHSTCLFTRYLDVNEDILLSLLYSFRLHSSVGVHSE
jgi:hypothetical protein